MSSAHENDGFDSARAVILLEQRGYEATSVDELAEAYGISRSTFFRRFRSKDDVVFADHDAKIAQIAARLVEHGGDPLIAVGEAGLEVLEHSIADPETARARYRLLQAVPVLRDREVISSHRYERVFSDHLRAALPESANRELGGIAFAAAVVALHNAVLRAWLRADAPDGQDALAVLRTQLDALAAVYRPYLALHPADAPEVFVARLAPGASDAEIVRMVRGAQRTA